MSLWSVQGRESALILPTLSSGCQGPLVPPSFPSSLFLPISLSPLYLSSSLPTSLLPPFLPHLLTPLPLMSFPIPPSLPSLPLCGCVCALQEVEEAWAVGGPKEHIPLVKSSFSMTIKGLLHCIFGNDMTDKSKVHQLTESYFIGWREMEVRKRN